MARARRVGKATFNVDPNLRRKLQRSQAVKDLLWAAGQKVAADMDDITRADVAAARAGRAGFGRDAIISGGWVEEAKSGAGGDGGYVSTGRLASSWGARMSLGRDGWIVLVGSGAGTGSQEVEYAGVYLWGYDPTGPRAHYQWGGNDVFEKAFARNRIRYQRPYPRR